MEKIKIEDLYCGEKYHIKNAVYEKAKRAQIDSCADGGRAWCEQEFIRQMLIAISKELLAGQIHPDIGGKRISRNVYAPTEAECEAKLESLIIEMKEELGIA